MVNYEDYPKPIKLEFGGGGSPLPGYLNCDMVGGDNTEFVINVQEPLPFPDNWADEIIGIHILEHMPWTYVDKIFKEWTRVLSTRGLMIIEVPNMKEVFQGVLNGTWHLQFRNDNLGGNAMVPIWGEVTPNQWMHHKSGYTPGLLLELFTISGYKDITWINNDGNPISEHQLGWAMRIRGTKI